MRVTVTMMMMRKMKLKLHILNVLELNTKDV